MSEERWSTDIDVMADQIKVWRQSKGFETPHTLATKEQREATLGKLMLVVTEVGEAAEAVRHEDRENFEEEIADTVIRCMDISATMGFSLYDAIAKKMDVNAGRPIRHGKKTGL